MYPQYTQYIILTLLYEALCEIPLVRKRLNDEIVLIAATILQSLPYAYTVWLIMFRQYWFCRNDTWWGHICFFLNCIKILIIITIHFCWPMRKCHCHVRKMLLGTYAHLSHLFAYILISEGYSRDHWRSSSVINISNTFSYRCPFPC